MAHVSHPGLRARPEGPSQAPSAAPGSQTRARARSASVSRRVFLAMLVVMPVIASPARVFAEPTDVLDVVVFADGRLQIGDRPVDEAQLEAAARQLVTAVGRDRARATIAADRAVPYARMIEVIDALQRGGLQQISMLVAPEGS